MWGPDLSKPSFPGSSRDIIGPRPPLTHALAEFLRARPPMPVLLPRRASPGTAEGAKASAAGDMATRVNAATFDADTILSNEAPVVPRTVQGRGS